MQLSHIITKDISKGVVNNKVVHSTKNKDYNYRQVGYK